MSENVAAALLLTTIAGLSTTVGSVLGIIVRKPGTLLMSITFGFAAGIMILVSFVELLQRSIETVGFAYGQLAFFGGMAIMFLIDILIPHEYFAEHGERAGRQARLHRTGLLVALGVGIHNFPEGMATFAGSLEDFNLGLAIAAAIALHNIPEGLAVAAPVYAATGSRLRAFALSFVSGLAEPVGAGVAAVALYPFLNGPLLGWMLAAVGGLMVFISLDELVPSSREYGHDHAAILAVIVGMAVMAASLWLLL